LVVFPILYF
jgi:glutathione S-transferase